MGRSLPFFLLLACGGTPRTLPRPAGVPVAKVEPPPPHLSLVTDSSVASRVPSSPSPPLAAFHGNFEKVALPARSTEVVSVSGRGGDDVWMLTKSGEVFHWDGKSVQRHAPPLCFTDQCCGNLIDCEAQPARCTPKAMKDCQPFQCTIPVTFQSVGAGRSEVLVSAFVDTHGLRPSLVEARLRKDGSWSCVQESDDLLRPGAFARGAEAYTDELTVDGVPIRLEGPAVLVNQLGGYSLLVDGRRVELPVNAFVGQLGLVAAAPDDLWLWWSQGSLWRGNGVEWEAIGMPTPTLDHLWLEDRKVLWAFSAGDDKTAASLLRRNAGDAEWLETAVPRASHVMHAGPHAFALLGNDALYWWNGRRLSRTDVPLVVVDAWLSPSGEVWLAGGERVANAAEQGAGAGVVVRMTPPSEESP